MKPPARIATPESAAQVTREVKRLLRAAEIRNELPTPREEILKCVKLVETGEIDLAEYEATRREKALRLFHRAVSKVLGLLDRRSEIIYVDSGIYPSRRNFVTYHEVTHKILPWQRIITITEDDELTMSSECEELFEAEANYGAAEILFQCERFEQEARDYNLSIGSALSLAASYDASCHATLRRFVERNHRPCLLMVLTPTSRQYGDGRASYYVVYCVPSGSFTAGFGEPFGEVFVNPGSELGGIINGGSEGEITLRDVSGFYRLCDVEVFNNNFNTFVLIYPKQAHVSRKTVCLKINGVPLPTPLG